MEQAHAQSKQEERARAAATLEEEKAALAAAHREQSEAMAANVRRAIDAKNEANHEAEKVRIFERARGGGIGQRGLS